MLMHITKLSVWVSFRFKLQVANNIGSVLWRKSVTLPTTEFWLYVSFWCSLFNACDVFWTVCHSSEKSDCSSLFQGLHPSHSGGVAALRLRYAHLRIFAWFRYSGENRCLKLWKIPSHQLKKDWSKSAREIADRKWSPARSRGSTSSQAFQYYNYLATAEQNLGR